MITIAIDGYSSTGKSTMARQLASNIGYKYIDSGAMYRAVALYALQHGIIDDGVINKDRLIESIDVIRISFRVNSDGSQTTLLNGNDVETAIREMAVSQVVSKVAAIAEVRNAMVMQQRLMGENGGIVMDGRDIGTTVFPDAELKIFVTATPEIRARRRYDELIKKGESVEYAEVLKNVKERDFLDETREISPLRKAPDAILMDNSEMTLGEQNDYLLQLFKQYNL